MPPFHFWFSGTAVAAFIGVVGSLAALAGTSYGWYSAASSSFESVKLVEKSRRDRVLANLTQLYITSHDGIAPRMMAGLELPPKEWLNQELEKLGERWRVP